MTEPTRQNLLVESEADEASQTGGCGGHCTCGENAVEVPELDARLLPPAIRHASIFGALSSVAPGGSMVVIAPHAPVPLLDQLEAADPGVWTYTITQSAPEDFRVLLTRAA